MNPVQQRLQKAVAAACYGHIPLPPIKDRCLQAVRLVIEDAFGWPDGEIYRRICTHRVGDDWKRDTFWAADLELSLRRRGWVTTAPQPGCLVFGALPSPEGHVGLVFRGEGGRLWVFENARIKRRGGRTISGYNQVVPLENWERITTIGLLPAELLETPSKPQPIPKRNETPVHTGPGAALNDQHPGWPSTWVELWDAAGYTGMAVGLSEGEGKRKAFLVSPTKMEEVLQHGK